MVRHDLEVRRDLQTLLAELPVEELADLLILQTVVLNDLCPELDAVIIYGETVDNEASVLLKAKELFERQKGNLTVIITAPKYPLACKHEKRYRLGLHQLGVPPGRIMAINFPDDGIPANTYSESVQAMEWLADHNIGPKIGVIAAPFHILRTIVSAWSAQNKNSRSERFVFFPIPGAYLPWQEEVVHSQGVLMGTRQELVLHELMSLLRYHRKGDLISPSHALRIYNSQRG